MLPKHFRLPLPFGFISLLAIGLSGCHTSLNHIEDVEYIALAPSVSTSNFSTSSPTEIYSAPTKDTTPTVSMPPDAASENIVPSIKQDTVTVDDFANAISDADFILLGELHGTKEHHQLQHAVLEILIEHQKKPALVFEMFDQEQAALIDAVVSRPKVSAGDLARAVDWKKSGWPEWRYYRPLVRTALDNDLEIVAGNLSRKDAFSAVKKIAAGEAPDSLIPAHLNTMGLENPLPNKDFEKLKALLDHTHHSAGHEQQTSSETKNPAKKPNEKERHEEAAKDTLEESERSDHAKRFANGMYFAQRLRDATLASNMLGLNADTVVLIAGRQHTRQDYGVPHYIRLSQTDKKIISIAFVSKSGLTNSKLTEASNNSKPAFNYLMVYD